METEVSYIMKIASAPGSLKNQMFSILLPLPQKVNCFQLLLPCPWTATLHMMWLGWLSVDTAGMALFPCFGDYRVYLSNRQIYIKSHQLMKA